MDAGESGGSAHGLRAELNIVKKTMRIPKADGIFGKDSPLLNCRLRDAHSALMPAALIIGHHFSISAF